MWMKRNLNVLVVMAIFIVSSHAQFDPQPQQHIQVQQPQQPIFFQQPQENQQFQQPAQQQQQQQQLFNPFQMFFRTQQNPTQSNNFQTQQPQTQPQNFPILSRLVSAFKNAFTRSPQSTQQQQQQQQQQFFQQNQHQFHNGPLQPSNTIFQVVPPPTTSRRPTILDNFFG